MIRWAFFEMKRLPSKLTPRCTRDSISSMSEPGSTTTPQPITHRQPLCRMPEGMVCSTYFSRPTTTVWPALLPPWKRTTTSTCGVITSTTLPLPSSPHCVPTTTMLGTVVPSQLFEIPRGTVQHVGERQRALGPVPEIDVEQRTRRRLRPADHQGAPHALRPRIRERLLERPAHDVARDRRAEITQPPGQRQGSRFLRR